MKMGDLHAWFLQNKRDFFWRKHRSPYIVWISEVMLQQTRASVIEPYLKNWLALFPDIETLALAPIEKVIKAWEGLGYYSRARNLHLAAQEMLKNHKGQVPSNPAELAKIAGIGPYTQGAILSFAFHQKAAAIDGNVVRVITRLFAIENLVEKVSTQKAIREKVENMLDPQEPWITMEALIELGSEICTKTPRCDDCPLKNRCLSKKKGIAENLPLKKEKEKAILLFRTVAVVLAEKEILLKKGEKKKVMADLYEFPYFPLHRPSYGRKEAEKEIFTLLKQKPLWKDTLGTKVHTFTKYKAHLIFHLFTVEKRQFLQDYVWVPLLELETLPFSSGHRELARNLRQRLD